MTFLAPALLMALGAVSAPIIIHLLNKTQTRRVHWAAMRFLLECVEKNRRRMKIEELLLLLLRCLLVALIVLAFARPLWNAVPPPPAKGSDGPVAVVVLLDASLSMGYAKGGESCFERAKKEVTGLVSALPPGSSAALFVVSDTLQKIIPVPVADTGLVSRAVQGLAPGYGTSNLAEGIRAAVDLLSANPDLPGEIYVISDNQQYAWRDLNSVSALASKAKGRISIHVRPVGIEDAGNAAISDIRLDESIPAPGQPFQCRVQVSNWNSNALTDVPVKLFADGTVAAEVTIPRIAPGQSETVDLSVRFDHDGFHAMQATIPHDDLPADDERSLAVSSSDQVRILIVEESTGRQISDRDSFFLAQALMPVKANQSFHLKAITLPVAELSGERLEGIDVVILANVSQINREGSQTLRNFVASGGGLLVFPGPSANLEFYNNDPVFAPLMPAKLGRKVEVRDGTKAPLLQVRGFTHPVFALWNDPRLSGLEGIYFLGYYPLKPVEGAIVAATMTGDQPAIVEERVGKGRSILFNTNAMTRWTNLPLNPSFVPLLHRLVGYTASHSSRELRLAPGAPFVFNAAPSLSGRDFFVRSPDGKKQAGGKIGAEGIIRYTATEKTGAYSIFSGADSPEPLAVFAVQTDPSESNLWPAPVVELAGLKEFGKESGRGAQASGESSLEGRNIPLWTALMIAALIAAMAEMALAWKISRSY